MNTVAIGCTVPIYNSAPPFHPHCSYPESRFQDRSQSPNLPYHLFRRLLLDLGLDSTRYGTAEWNPFGHMVSPGQTVLIKPNFVLDRNLSGGDLFASITHPSLLRAIVDYLYIALSGDGKIIIADAPQIDCDWVALMKAQRLDAVQDFYHARFGFDIEVHDLRSIVLRNHHLPAYDSNKRGQPGDLLGEQLVDLGARSAFREFASTKNFYGADYNRGELASFHSGGRHCYAISRTVLTSDLIVSVPKLKVHKKVGVTLNLKGLVGITTQKNCLIHYRLGTPKDGGDQLPDGGRWRDRSLVRAQRALFDTALARGGPRGEKFYRAALELYRRTLKRVWRVRRETALYDSGNWHGNDSAWRMTFDLAQILYFSDRRGEIRQDRQRRIFCLVDGIVGGEGEGPLAPTPKPSGCLIAGEDPVSVDLVGARAMGVDIRSLRLFRALLDERSALSIDPERDICVIADGTELRDYFDPQRRAPDFSFLPHPGWMGHIEVDRKGKVVR